MARHTLDQAYRGGRVEPDLPADPPPPRVQRYPCFADGCPMAGTIFPNGTADGKPGVCVYHYAVNATDIPKVTQVLRDWGCVADEVRAARRCITGPMASDPAALQAQFDAAWERLAPLVPSWHADLAPGTIRTSKGQDTGHRQAYGDWAKHLERFLGARVVEVLSVRRATA